MLKNPPRLEGSSDLTNLSYLHEAAVLHSVKIRYLQEIIYTYSGLVLIAMNPFKKLNIYSEDVMKRYAGRNRNELDPHLFAVAEEAYRRLVNQRENQSVIVSGESGAGKTMTAKFVMKYFATIDDLTNSSKSNNSGTNNGGQISIEDAVLSTNPIMEAFGNAKTTRNDNSSRFGKYIEIVFKNQSNIKVTITGARMRTYLLERSRLVFQPYSERNYHIFYQLCAGCPAAEKSQLGLSNWDKFHYLNQGSMGVVNGVDDAQEFEITQKGMSMVGISLSTQWDVFRVCAALLHMGNIKITDGGGTAKVDVNDSSLLKACELLQIDGTLFHKWLLKKQIKMRSETIEKDLKYDDAITARDSIAKFIYSMMFDWICKVCNNKLEPKGADSADTCFIGVLDIYGFEHFQKNSFEQFCINFANEKLQQEFTRHVFKLEQQEYVAEKIKWSFIDFSDNAQCIEMIEGKLGLMDLLDEESRLPSGEDKKLIQKLYNRFGPDQHKFFEQPRFGQSEFIIKHYAVDVTYQIEGFIEKNKDTINDEQLDMLNASKMDFLNDVLVFPTMPAAAKAGRPGAPSKKPTLGTLFKGSLISLMDTLRKTNPHYIRCIKPNQSKVAFEYEAQNVLGQLIACGVLETIKISRAGYPSKQLYADFVNRYYLLTHSSKWKTEPKSLTEMICKSTLKAGNFEMGSTKVFFRAGQLGYLEKIRTDKFMGIVILIQKNAKRNMMRKKYKMMKNCIKAIQHGFRAHFARMSNIPEPAPPSEPEIPILTKEESPSTQYGKHLDLGTWQFDPEEPEKPTLDVLETELFNLEEQLEILRFEVKQFEQLATDKKLDFAKQIREMNTFIRKLVYDRDQIKKEILRLTSVLRRKDEYIQELQQYRAQKDAEISQMKDSAQSGDNDDMQTALMKNEINMLRVQMEALMDEPAVQRPVNQVSGGWVC